MSAVLRGLPSVDALAHTIGDGDPLCVGAARQVIDEVRHAVLSGDVSVLPDVEALATERLSVLRGGRLRRVLNATGVVLHTNLGRSEWSEAAQLAAVTAMGATNLEMWLSSGKRGGRTHGIDVLLRHLTGCEAALVVNNCAAAVLLALTALAAGREVVVSRGELVEIGGSFRVPDVIASCGARLVEVGTTNRTRASDFAKAVGPYTAVLLRVHPSNFRVVGFTEAPERRALAAVAKAAGVPMLEDLGAGSLDGRSQEPAVRKVLEDGVDVAMFSGDKLLGGPQAGILVGKREIIATLRAHPLYRALRVDKVTLAALEATLVGHATGDGVPTAHRLDVLPDALWDRAGDWAERLRGIGAGAEAVRCDDAVGGGALPGQALSGAAVVVACDAQRVATRLRTGRIAVVGRVHDGALWLHPRCVNPGDDDALTGLVAEALELR